MERQGWLLMLAMEEDPRGALPPTYSVPITIQRQDGATFPQLAQLRQLLEGVLDYLAEKNQVDHRRVTDWVVVPMRRPGDGEHFELGFELAAGLWVRPCNALANAEVTP